MTPQRVSKLKIGDRVRERYGRRGTVVGMMPIYIGVRWDSTMERDILARTSPLWANIEVMAED